MGEWPGPRRTFPRGLGADSVAVEARLLPLLTRCWLLDGIPRLGTGPFEGTRRLEAGLGGGAIDGRDGGGMSVAGLEYFIEG